VSDQPREVDLTAEWNAERCPIIDGIVFGDGRVRRIATPWRQGKSGRLEIVIEPVGWTSLAELAKTGELQWTGIISLSEAIDLARNIRILGGEGGLGGDGFVANVRNDDGMVVWIAFFTSSNPFEVVQIHGDHVLAKTNLGTWWHFPVDAPDRVTLLQ
jgi:hypothetical protein